jgi:hypothetical protein
LIHSTSIHVAAAVAVAIWVTSAAIPATPSAASSLPALTRPSQPAVEIGDFEGCGALQPA